MTQKLAQDVQSTSQRIVAKNGCWLLEVVPLQREKSISRVLRCVGAMERTS